MLDIKFGWLFKYFSIISHSLQPTTTGKIIVWDDIISKGVRITRNGGRKEMRINDILIFFRGSVVYQIN